MPWACGSSLLCLFDAELLARVDLAVLAQAVEFHEVVHGHAAELAGDVPEVVSGADGIYYVTVRNCSCRLAVA